MRLIDADAMLERLQEWNTSDDMDKALYRFTLDRIIEQPTAFDVDKVVGQLEAEQQKYAAQALETDDTDEVIRCVINEVAMQTAIDIVKRSGKE